MWGLSAKLQIPKIFSELWNYFSKGKIHRPGSRHHGLGPRSLWVYRLHKMAIVEL
jgi:hypothetical protein